MQRISKPHIVDLLRYFDRNRLFSPRIRYASVRSKPELIADIKEHFTIVQKTPFLLEFRLKRRAKNSGRIPPIEYDLKKRHYLFEGQFYDIPRESRKKVVFSISRVPVTLHFPSFRLPVSTG